MTERVEDGGPVVTVKPLEWGGHEGYGGGLRYKIAPPSMTPGWRVWAQFAGRNASVGGQIITVTAETEDLAKSAAQADYERRILSALVITRARQMGLDVGGANG